MTRFGTLTAGAALGLAFGLTLAPGTASAGPCTQQIADLGKQLAMNAGLGGTPTTGTLTGAAPNSTPTGAPQPSASTQGTSADNRMSGVAPTQELSAAVTGTETPASGQDVQRQQNADPTAAQDPDAAPTAPGGMMAAAKQKLEQARTMDQNGDSACSGVIAEVQKMVAG